MFVSFHWANKRLIVYRSKSVRRCPDGVASTRANVGASVAVSGTSTAAGRRWLNDYLVCSRSIQTQTASECTHPNNNWKLRSTTKWRCSIADPCSVINFVHWTTASRSTLDTRLHALVATCIYPVKTYDTIHDMIDDLHWKTDRQASCQFHLAHKLLKK